MTGETARSCVSVNMEWGGRSAPDEQQRRKKAELGRDGSIEDLALGVGVNNRNSHLLPRTEGSIT